MVLCTLLVYISWDHNHIAVMWMVHLSGHDFMKWVCVFWEERRERKGGEKEGEEEVGRGRGVGRCNRIKIKDC